MQGDSCRFRDRKTRMTEGVELCSGCGLGTGIDGSKIEEWG